MAAALTGHALRPLHLPSTESVGSGCGNASLSKAGAIYRDLTGVREFEASLESTVAVIGDRQCNMHSTAAE